MLPSTRPGFLIVASGLLAEARIASGRAVRPIAGGGNGARLATDIDRAIADGGCGLLSFGLAGGLEAHLAPGTLVISSTVVSGKERFATNKAWTAGLQAALPDAVERTVAGVDAPVASLLAKQVLRANTGAAAADMESHVAARAAARVGLPFAVLRVIADPGERALPEAAVVGMGSDGRPDLAAVLASLAHRPAQFAALLRVAADARHAMAALVRCRHLLGPGFGLRLPGAC